jgi:hypothetical protein
MLMPFFIPGISKAKRYGINHHKSNQMTKEMEFDYYIDTKYTIWGRERYTIVAELKEKADEIMMDIFENGDTHGLCYDFEYNVSQIGGRFNAANVLLYAAFITNLI